MPLCFAAAFAPHCHAPRFTAAFGEQRTKQRFNPCRGAPFLTQTGHTGTATAVDGQDYAERLERAIAASGVQQL